MGDLQASLEFLVELYKFYNVDLFIRGYYQFRLSFKPPKSSHSVQVEVFEGHGEKGAFTLFPAYVTNDGQTAVSRTFNIYYKDEEVLLKDVFLFRVHLLIDSSKAADCIDKAALEMNVDVHFTDQAVREHNYQTLPLVTSRTLKFHFSCFNGLHHQLPLLFDYYYFSVLELVIHANVVSLGLPNWSILKQVKTGWFSKSNPVRSSTPLFYSTLFGNRSQFAGQFNSDIPLKYVMAYSSSVSQENLEKASAIHRNLCAVLAMAHSQLLNYFENMMQYLDEKQRITLGEKLDPAELVEGLCKKLETLLSCEEIFDEMCGDMSVLNNELALLWLQFQESFTLNDKIRQLLREEHHIERMTHLREAFFVHELPWKSLLSDTDSSFQKHTSMGQCVKSSKYFALIPPVTVECAAVDGDSTSIPIFFEDLYTNTKESCGTKVAVRLPGNLEAEILEHKPLSSGILNHAFNDHSPQVTDSASSDLDHDVDAQDVFVQIDLPKVDTVDARVNQAGDCTVDTSQVLSAVINGDKNGNQGQEGMDGVPECACGGGDDFLGNSADRILNCNHDSTGDLTGTETWDCNGQNNVLTGKVDKMSDDLTSSEGLVVDLLGNPGSNLDEMHLGQPTLDVELVNNDSGVADASHVNLNMDSTIEGETAAFTAVSRTNVENGVQWTNLGDEMKGKVEEEPDDSQDAKNGLFFSVHENCEANQSEMSGCGNDKSQCSISNDTSHGSATLLCAEKDELLDSKPTCGELAPNTNDIFDNHVEGCFGKDSPCDVEKKASTQCMGSRHLTGNGREFQACQGETQCSDLTVNVQGEIPGESLPPSEIDGEHVGRNGDGNEISWSCIERSNFIEPAGDQNPTDQVKPGRNVNLTNSSQTESKMESTGVNTDALSSSSNMQSNGYVKKREKGKSASIILARKVTNSVFYEEMPDVNGTGLPIGLCANAKLDAAVRLSSDSSFDLVSCLCGWKPSKDASSYRPANKCEASNSVLLRVRQDVMSQMKFCGNLYCESLEDFHVHPYFMMSKPDLSFEPVHFVVCVHGLDGNSGDLRLVRCFLEMVLPSTKFEFLMSQVNQDNTFLPFEKLTENLVSEMLHHMDAYKISPSRISFVGHSLGNIIIRSALHHPQLEPYVELFHTFLSLSGPHLGMIHHTSSLVSTGMWLMQKWKKSDSLLQLSLNDSTNIRETFMYKLSQQKGLEYFSNVLLVSSVQDHYVPFHSARIEIPKSLRSNSQECVVYHEMIENILSPLLCQPNRTLARYSVYHCLPSSTNTFIGRAAHIAMLDSELFIEKLICTSAAKYFQ